MSEKKKPLVINLDELKKKSDGKKKSDDNKSAEFLKAIYGTYDPIEEVNKSAEFLKYALGGGLHEEVKENLIDPYSNFESLGKILKEATGHINADVQTLLEGEKNRLLQSCGFHSSFDTQKLVDKELFSMVDTTDMLKQHLHNMGIADFRDTNSLASYNEALNPYALNAAESLNQQLENMSIVKM